MATEAEIYSAIAQYQAQADAAQRTHEANVAALEQNRNRALQEAYLLHRSDTQRLPQLMAIGGRNGGLGDTARVRLDNAYQNARNYQELDYQNQLSQANLNLENTVNPLRAQIGALQQQAYMAALEEEARRRAAAANVGGGALGNTISQNAKDVSASKGLTGTASSQHTGTRSNVSKSNGVSYRPATNYYYPETQNPTSYGWQRLEDNMWGPGY